MYRQKQNTERMLRAIEIISFINNSLEWNKKYRLYNGKDKELLLLKEQKQREWREIIQEEYNGLINH